MSKIPIHDDGEWISGSMADERPEFSPHALVFEVQDVLGRAGIVVSTDGRMQTAVVAAADLLRALGVRPATAPERQS